MTVLIKNVRVIDSKAQIDVKEDVLISKDGIEMAPLGINLSCQIIDGKNCLLIPGLIDLHVHFREPGFCHKEDIASGIKAALKGGVTSALVMPNTLPPIDCYSRVKFQLARAKPCGFDLMVAGAATRELKGMMPSDIGILQQAGVKAVTDDGKPILESCLMEDVLKLCRRYNLVCMQHAEDVRLSKNASLNLSRKSEYFGILGQPSLAEFALVARDIDLAEKISARYHVLHLSCRESLRMVERAKRRKASITCEVSPHHLMLSDCDVGSLDTNKKMNPPLRSKQDIKALLEGLCDGSIDAVASDHAPHAKKEKKLSFIDAPFGVIGVESSILVLLTLVKKGKLSLKRAIEAMTTGPAQILQEPYLGTMLGPKAAKNAVLIDPNYRSQFSERNIASHSKNSPFIGMELYGKVLMTFLNGEIAYSGF